MVVFLNRNPKLIVEMIAGNCCTINLGLRCFWDTQPWLCNANINVLVYDTLW